MQILGTDVDGNEVQVEINSESLKSSMVELTKHIAQQIYELDGLRYKIVDDIGSMDIDQIINHTKDNDYRSLSHEVGRLNYAIRGNLSMLRLSRTHCAYAEECFFALRTFHEAIKPTMEAIRRVPNISCTSCTETDTDSMRGRCADCDAHHSNFKDWIVSDDVRNAWEAGNRKRCKE